MKTSQIGALVISCMVVLSATPVSTSYKSKADAYPTIALCGTMPDWKSIIRDSVSKPVLFNNLGDFQFPIATQVKEAQQYFNQGIRLYYGFNHREAFKAFQYASKLDSSSAMCWWGQALALGPHINMPMMDSTSSFTAYDAIKKAIAIGSKNARENDFIVTQAVRYAKDFNTDRSALDAAYVEASRKLAEKYPTDADALALAGEAIMDVHYWDYWEYDGRPKTWTPEILNRLEGALTVNPLHPGANHFYIHAVEASKEPSKGSKSAERLQTLMPGAGHMVHMPSHIFIRTGQYEKGSHSNEKAAQADEEYFKTSFEEGFYSIAYYPHNYHFYWACSAFEGNYAKALRGAQKVQAKTNTEWMQAPEYSFLQHLYSTPIYTMVQFGKWKEILETPLSFKDQPYLTGVWSYAQGLAYCRQGGITKAEQCLKELKESQSKVAVPESAWINNPKNILKIAEKILDAELHAKAGKKNEAKQLYEDAVKAEDALRYNEPADWHKPVRQIYGAYLISINDFKRAEEMYREDLTMYPENGWSLLGLHQSLKGQRKNKEAEEVKKQFEKSWSRSDTKITASSF